MTLTTDHAGTITQRITAEGLWMAETAIHTGGEGRFESNVDMAVARDKQGRYYLAGSSLAGAARSHLARCLATSFDNFRSGAEEDGLKTLFGGSLRSQANDPAYASLLLWYEAYRQDTGPSVAVRDGVRIEGKTNQAAAKGKYNLEVLPAGTSFKLRVELLIYDEMPPGIDEATAKGLLRQLLEGFRPGGIALGARTRKGLGQGGVARWTLREFDLRTNAGTLDWLGGDGFSGGKILQPEDLGGTALASPAERFTITAQLRLRMPLFVRAGAADLNGPDATHFEEAGQPWLPGTSLNGVLRHRVERVANTLGAEGEAVGRELFGIANRKEHPERAARVWIREVPLPAGGERTVQSRVSIDRFTGGALDARLFDGAPYWGKPGDLLSVTIGVDNPSADERMYILAAFKDLWLGDLSVGGEAGVGRGVLEGVTATIAESGRGLSDMEWRRDEAGRTTITHYQAWQGFLAEARR